MFGDCVDCMIYTSKVDPACIHASAAAGIIIYYSYIYTALLYADATVLRRIIIVLLPVTGMIVSGTGINRYIPGY